MGVRAASNEPGPRASNSHEEPTASLHCYATNKTHECHVLDHFAPECYARLGHSRLSSSSGGRRSTSSGSRLGSRSSLGSSSSRGSSWCLLLFNLLSGSRSRSRSLGGRGCRSSGRLVLLRLLVLLGLLGGLRGLGSRSSSSYSDERSVSTSSATARGWARLVDSLGDLPAGAAAVSVFAGSEAAAAVVVSAGLVSSAAFFSPFFLKMDWNLAFKFLSASGAVARRVHQRQVHLR